MATGQESSLFIDEQNESANEDEAIENEDNAENVPSNSKYHQNMSDITNIQMQLDNIKVNIQKFSNLLLFSNCL